MRHERPLIHVCIRETLDWHDASLVAARILPRFRRKFDVWNDTFTMPYHLFRDRLKAITMLSVSRIDGAVLSRIDDVPRGDLIVPLDDDDWLAPDLAVRLHQFHQDETAGYLWVREALEYRSVLAELRAHVGPLVGRPDRWLCKTNNYAVRNEPRFVPLALNHMRASEYFDSHPSDVTRIAATLGMQNRTLASQTSLDPGRPTISKRKVSALLGKYRAVYRAWTPTPPLDWAVPYVELMRRLMDDIDVR